MALKAGLKVGDSVLYFSARYKIEHDYGSGVYRIGNGQFFFDMVTAGYLVKIHPCSLCEEIVEEVINDESIKTVRESIAVISEVESKSGEFTFYAKSIVCGKCFRKLLEVARERRFCVREIKEAVYGLMQDYYPPP